MSIKVQFSERSGFYMSMASDSVTKNELPTYFINVVQRKKQLHFTTIELVRKH
jgi:DNA mismatch repair protein MSH4